MAERQKPTALAGMLARLPGKETGKAKVPDSPRDDGVLVADGSRWEEIKMILFGVPRGDSSLGKPPLKTNPIV